MFSCYIDKLFSLNILQDSGLGCHVGSSYPGSFGYADDIALLAPSMQCLKKMILTCESYAKSHSITFNPNKSKLLCYNVDETVVLPPIYLNGEMIPVVDSDKHLGNYISTNIADGHIIENMYDLYQRSNRIISDFRVCDSSTLDSLHRTCNYVKDFIVAWRKVKRHNWKLPYRAHNAIVHNLSYDIDLQLDTNKNVKIWSFGFES